MANLTSRTVTTLHSLCAENHYVDSQSHIGFHVWPSLAESKSLSPQTHRATQCVCQTQSLYRLCDQVFLHRMTEKYLSCHPNSIDSQKTVRFLYNAADLLQYVYAQHFLIALAHFNKNYDSYMLEEKSPRNSYRVVIVVAAVVFLLKPGCVLQPCYNMWLYVI